MSLFSSPGDRMGVRKDEQEISCDFFHSVENGTQPVNFTQRVDAAFVKRTPSVLYLYSFSDAQLMCF